MKKIGKKIVSIIFAALLAVNIGVLSASAASTGVDDGTIMFPSEVMGDVNNDTRVNVKDLVRLKKYFADDTVEISVVNADIKGVNAILAEDLTGIRNLLLGI